eukprot:TRINITY_DN1987_c1_g1_i1.p1 TRINITY_DN1987_c1_g1~~TRINITY_DN1987_c1_g1_i1.p1  ORF type:complete len:136 (+),score=29.14 TRINITY_DN1987_c1_g1_i1:64-471(+)
MASYSPAVWRAYESVEYLLELAKDPEEFKKAISTLSQDERATFGRLLGDIMPGLDNARSGARSRHKSKEAELSCTADADDHGSDSSSSSNVQCFIEGAKKLDDIDSSFCADPAVSTRSNTGSSELSASSSNSLQH